MPHATDILACRKIKNTTEINKNDVTIPKAVIKKLILVSLLLLCKTLSNLIDNIGNTQGMIFNISPPIKAVKI